MKYLLSISIPTYNRSQLLEETIECFARQVKDSMLVQIAVADNCSSDDTEEMICRLQSKYSFIKYVKNETNLGADRNYLKSVEISDGTYCWLFGSDDQIDEGALGKVYKQIEAQELDILVFNRVNMDPELIERRDVQSFFDAEEAFQLDFSKDESYLTYSNRAVDIAAMYSYLSSIVIKKSSWDSVETEDFFIGGAYIHVSKIFRMMDHGALFKFLPDPLVLNRQGNDHFAGNGYVNRRLIDVGYVDLVEKSFSKEERKQPLRRIVEREFFQLSKMLAFKMWTFKYQTSDDFKQLFEGYRKFEKYPYFYLKMLCFKFVPVKFLKVIYKLFY